MLDGHASTLISSPGGFEDSWTTSDAGGERLGMLLGMLLTGGWAGETRPATSAGAVSQKVRMYVLICSFPSGLLLKAK